MIHSLCRNVLEALIEIEKMVSELASEIRETYQTNRQLKTNDEELHNDLKLKT